VSTLTFERNVACARLGLKGPRAGDWLSGQGVALPQSSNRWISSADEGTAGATLLIARLGSSEFFLEGSAASGRLQAMAASLAGYPTGVYPVLREDWSFMLQGDTLNEALAQICNVDFAGLNLETRPVIMTLMMGIAVLAVPDKPAAGRRCRLWCDPSFGPFFENSFGEVVRECGGIFKGVSA
jgi:sarcosine oxidase, subunit gamma